MSTPKPVTIADVFKSLRNYLGMTQIDAAFAIKKTQSAISKIEKSGDCRISDLANMAKSKNKRLRIDIIDADGTTCSIAY